MSEEELREKIAETYFIHHWRVRDAVTFSEQHRAVKVICHSFADQILTLIKEAGYVRLANDQTLPEQVLADSAINSPKVKKGKEDYMRDLKFRAWHTKELLRADIPRMEYFTLSDLYWRGEDTGDYDFPDCSTIIMQYTGLKDKNGKEIYESDKVSDGINPEFIVIWDFALLSRLNEVTNRLVVTGNIYEH